MSRVGRKPIVVPDKVKIEPSDGWLSVTGPLGAVKYQIPSGVTVKIADGIATVQKPEITRVSRGYQGLVRALLANMVEGVTKGFERSLEVSGVGYKAELKGNRVSMMVGFSHAVGVDLPEGVKAVVDKAQTGIKITGADKQKVMQVAAQLRAFKPCEPYKAKGVKYSDEIVRRKVGKAGAK